MLQAGLRLGCPIWRLLTHDLSKFSLAELPHYGRQFFGSADDPRGFINCLVHHQNRNDHHWEYWIPRTGHNRCNIPYPDNKPVEMPREAVCEMVADWMGASRTYEKRWPKPGKWEWLANKWPKIRERLAPNTRRYVEWLLQDYIRYLED